ncbi:Zinc finger protein 862, partial [Dissostichus eleginoides]
MRQLHEKLKASEFIGIIIDETVSITVENKLIAYDKIENKGKIDNFLGNYNLHSGTAQCIYEKVVEVLRGRGVELSKVMGLGSDGASVMTGKRAGVGALLKRVNPFLIQVHCVAHRAALAAVDT